MLVRHVLFPASPEELWDVLTEPDEVSAWFGAQVDWDLRPGGPARFVDDDGSVRGGVVEDVRRDRYLRFRWWPLMDGGPESQVTYDLEADGAGTRLTVTERLIAESGARRPADEGTSGQGTSGEGTSGQGDAGPQARAGAVEEPAHVEGPARFDAVEELADTGSSTRTSWTSWDGRLLRCWASASAPVAVGARRR